MLSHTDRPALGYSRAMLARSLVDGGRRGAALQLRGPARSGESTSGISNAVTTFPSFYRAASKWLAPDLDWVILRPVESRVPMPCPARETGFPWFYLWFRQVAVIGALRALDLSQVIHRANPISNGVRLRECDSNTPLYPLESFFLRTVD